MSLVRLSEYVLTATPRTRWNSSTGRQAGQPQLRGGGCIVFIIFVVYSDSIVDEDAGDGYGISKFSTRVLSMTIPNLVPSL